MKKISQDKLTKALREKDSHQPRHEDSTLSCVPPENISKKECEEFVMIVKAGRVIDVYDGDTITIASYVELNGEPRKLYKFSCRLNGIDTPEIKGGSPTEKECATIARDALRKLILGKVVTLFNHSKEKYGRVLADIYHDKIHLSEWMIEKRYAVPYDGGTKKTPSDWKVFFETGEM